VASVKRAVLRRRTCVDGVLGGGWVDARSHPGDSLGCVAHSSLDPLRRARVRATRRMLLPQKQVGSAPCGVGPTIRKRICAPQNRFGHCHHSSRLFFTNATSARFNAPRRCTLRCVRPHIAGSEPFRPRGVDPLKWFITVHLALAEHVPPKKIPTARDYDRTRSGWFSSQIRDSMRRRGRHGVSRHEASNF
jgi:hypothetical protein